MGSEATGRKWITAFGAAGLLAASAVLSLTDAHGASVGLQPPPQPLWVDGMQVTEGVFTLTGFELLVFDSVSNTHGGDVLIDRNLPSDDVVQGVTMGSASVFSIFSGPSVLDSIFNGFELWYQFDATVPDKNPISGHVLSVTRDVMLFLPHITNLPFYQIVDHAGTNTFFASAPVITHDAADPNSDSVDLFGDGSVFANGVEIVEIPGIIEPFQKHGNLTVVPEPGTLVMLAFGIAGIASRRRRAR